VILCDAGPLIALVDRRDREHVKCSTLLRTLSLPLVTTWPCFTEAMYFLGKTGGWALQRELWAYRDEGVLMIAELQPSRERRIQDLMAQYADLPMDLADASLVTAAEVFNLQLVFTLDSHFRIYRPLSGGTFEIQPG
jgi:predicted nucleic acid-binding protein